MQGLLETFGYPDLLRMCCWVCCQLDHLIELIMLFSLKQSSSAAAVIDAHSERSKAARSAAEDSSKCSYISLSHI